MESEARRCANVCNATAASLRKSGTAESLELVLEALRGGLNGTSEELDDAITAASKLRKAIMPIFSKSGWTEYSRVLCTIVFQIAHLLPKYLGDPAAQAQEKLRERFQQRLEIVQQSLGSLVKSVAYLVKVKHVHQDFEWATIDNALQDCAHLSKLVDLAWEQDGGHLKQKIEPAPAVELSNAYWTYFLSQKQDGQSAAALRRTLQRSVTVVSEQPHPQRLQASLSAKQEQLAVNLEQSGDLAGATESYARAIWSHVESGMLDSINEKLSTLSFAELLADDKLPKSFLRCVNAHVRITCTPREAASEHPLFLDRDTLDPVQRGFILEIQLQAVVKLATSPRILTWNKTLLQRLVELLLGIYAAASYPLRRLRVISQALRIHLIEPSIFNPEVVASLQANSVQEFAFDSSMARLQNHYAGRVNILHAVLGLASISKALSFIKDWRRSLGKTKAAKAEHRQFDDLQCCLKELDMFSDYLLKLGQLPGRIEVLRLSTRLCELQQGTKSTEYVSRATKLVLALSEAGLPKQAGAILEEASQMLVKSTVSKDHLLYLNIAKIRHYTHSGNMEHSQHCLEEATTLLRSVAASGPPTSRLYCIVADYLQALALNVWTFGSAVQAVYLQRRCVRISYALWERKAKVHPNPGSAPINPAASQHRHFPAEKQTDTNDCCLSEPPHTLSVELWSLGPRLFSRLLGLGILLSHEGLFEEAQYYIEDAIKIAEALGSDRYTLEAKIVRADYEVASGKVEAGSSQLQELKQLADSVACPLLSANYSLSWARVHATKGEDSEECGQLDLAHLLVVGHEKTDIVVEMQGQENATLDIEPRLRKLSLREEKVSKSRLATKAKLAASRKPKTKPEGSKQPREPLQGAQKQDPILKSGLTASITQLQAASALRRNRLEEAWRLLEALSESCGNSKDLFFQACGRAEYLIRRTISAYSTNPVFSLLRESTTSYPSIARAPTAIGDPVKDAPKLQELKQPPVRPAARKAKPGPQSAKVKSTKTGKMTAAGAMPRNAENAIPSESNEEHPDVVATRSMLSQCFKTLSAVQTASQKTASVAFIHKMADLLCKDAMMLSVAGTDGAQPRMSATFVAYAMEMGRCLATMRESSSIVSENLLHAEKEVSVFIDAQSLESELPVPRIDPATFLAEYVNIMPPTWVAVTISVSEDRQELRLSKLRAGQPPFVLSIPLARSSAHDPTEEGFSYEQCMTELASFIDLANFSTHDSSPTATEVSSKDWWQARSALDKRLRDLLLNVENIWLGGFRGVFFQKSIPREQMSRFQKSFYNILNKHLPSRRKNGKGPKASPVTFDPRILELFIGLGHPREVEECESSLMDLLYFVVDVLQFHGERNAYDEIDFDSITIEVMDALIVYHEAVRSRAPARTPAHTILVLDKALHAFPWESMPCLAGQAISRVPSLVALRTRILLQQAQQRDASTFPADGLYVDPSDGSYILNPEGDLVRTEATLQPHLAALPGAWAATVRRAPDEADITTALATRALYLYFGHGSGAHYVRARRIRRLEKCAVALLMGCSSGAVTAAGAFESSGTPLNYLFGGAPAVVGNLWDVTDRDIDRFSVRCLERWGLFRGEEAEQGFDEAASPLKGKGSRGKRNGNGKMAACLLSSALGEAPVGLDQAVAEAREACKLRYLNGAAPVVYGIPVYLWPRS